MGMSIGGISQAEPRNIYGWVGSTNCPAGSTTSQDLAVSGFTAGNSLLIKAAVIAVTPDNTAIGLTVVCGGSTYDLVGNTTTTTYRGEFTAYVKDGFQSTIFHFSSATTGGETTHAFSLADITAIRVKVTPVTSAGKILSISVLEQDD